MPYNHPSEVCKSIFLIYSEICTTITSIHFRVSSSPQRVAVSSHSPPPSRPPSPRQPPTTLLPNACVGLLILDTSCKWAHAVCDGLWLFFSRSILFSGSSMLEKVPETTPCCPGTGHCPGRAHWTYPLIGVHIHGGNQLAVSTLGLL